MRAKRKVRHIRHANYPDLFPFSRAYFSIRRTSKHRFARESVYEMFQLLHRLTAVRQRYKLSGKTLSASILFRFLLSFCCVRSLSSKFLFLVLALAFFAGGSAVRGQQPAAKSQEVSEEDGQPVLLKHLPDYEQVRGQAAFTTEKEALKATVGGNALLDLLEFPAGTEAVTAVYPQGRLVIVEYTNPQISVEIDGRIQQHLATNPDSGTVYRRIGNYNTFVFGATDRPQADALLEQVKYEKTVQWLGEDPYILKRLERYMVTTSKDIMISTVLVIVFGLLSALLAGIAAGFIFFRFRDHKRATRTAFSDAGGLTRLNLDGLSE